jgi:membrane-associated phospholipid phosphatase
MSRRFSQSLLDPSLRQRIGHGLLLFSVLSLALCIAAAAQEPPGPTLVSAADGISSALPDAPQSQTTGQTPANSQPPTKKNDDVTIANTPAHFLKDQAAIWTSPVRIREHDLAYLIPIGLATTLAFTVDHQTLSSSKLNDTSLNSHASTASNGLLGGFVAAPVIIYGLGHIHHDNHATETGILAGEAMVDSLVVDEVTKAVSRRERPDVDGAKGKFFQSGAGLNSSFPSAHTVIAWSSAAVIASEYDGPLTKITAYGLATGVSLTRVLAKQHFPSDVIVGSAVGWLVGRYVFHKHHKADEDY